ncbi:MAG: hypothetical protein DRJ38_08485 [Thermoprotei archaeon]|nr:MAG: hypothetical protein DRJ38_08485 [Thermoprotei archaeon]
MAIRRKGLGIKVEEELESDNKPVQPQTDFKPMVEKPVVIPSQPKMSVEEFKNIVRSLGGDTEWIDKIDSRLSQLESEIKELQNRINKLRAEKERLLALKQVLGLS